MEYYVRDGSAEPRQVKHDELVGLIKEGKVSPAAEFKSMDWASWLPISHFSGTDAAEDTGSGDNTYTEHRAPAVAATESELAVLTGTVLIVLGIIVALVILLSSFLVEVRTSFTTTKTVVSWNALLLATQYVILVAVTGWILRIAGKTLGRIEN